MSINEKNKPILVIIHQLLDYKYSQMLEFEIKELNEKRENLNSEESELKEQLNNADTSQIEAIRAKVSILTTQIETIKQEIDALTNKNKTKSTTLLTKLQSICSSAGIEYKNDLNIDKYLQDHPDLFQKETKTLLVDFNEAEGVFSEIKDNNELETLNRTTDRLITEILDFCSKDPNFQFDEHELKVLQSLIDSVKSEEKAHGNHEDLHAVADKEAKKVIALTFTEIGNYVAPMFQSKYNTLKQYIGMGTSTAPYISQHEQLATQVKMTLTNKKISKEGRLELVKELLSHYVKQHNIHNTVSVERINSLDDNSEAIDKLLIEVLNAQKANYQTQQKKSENSIVEINKKINSALDDSEYTANFPQNISDRYRNEVLKEICRRLLKHCIETKEELTSLGLKPLNGQNVDNYCNEVSQELLNNEKTPERFANKLKKINTSRKNCDQPNILQLCLSNASRLPFINNYYCQLTFMGLVGTGVIWYVYSHHKESTSQLLQKAVNIAVNKAFSAAFFGATIFRKAFDDEVKNKIGTPAVKTTSESMQNLIRYMFQSPNKNSPVNTASASSSPTHVNHDNDVNDHEGSDGDKLQQTPAKK